MLKLRDQVVDYYTYVQYHGRFPVIGDCAGIKKNDRSENSINGEFKVYPITGWVYIQDTTCDVNIVAQSDFFSFSHYQQDEISFILNANGRDLIIDPGLYSYDRSSPYNAFMRSARAHNVILVDDQDFQPDIHNTGLSGITRFYQADNGNPSSGIVEMTHPHYLSSGVEIYRQLAYPGNKLLVIKDLVRSKERHVYSQLFHFAPGASIVKVNGQYLIEWEHHPDRLRISTNAKDHLIVQGEDEPIQGWNFPRFNEVEEAPVLMLSKVGKNCSLQTSIEILSDGKTNKKSSARQTKQLFRSLSSIEKRELAKTPFPKKWRPERKR